MAVLALALVLPPPPPPLVGGGGGGGPRAKRTVHQHMRHAFGVLRRPDPSKADQRPAAQPNFPRREGVGRHEAVTGLFEQLTLLPVPRLAARRDAARLTPSSVPAPLLNEKVTAVLQAMDTIHVELARAQPDRELVQYTKF